MTARYALSIRTKDGAPRLCRWARLPNPAIQGGRLPATSGSSGTQAWDDHNSDTRRRNLWKLSVRKIWARSYTAGGVELEQLFLPGERRIQLRLDRCDSTLGHPDVKAAAQLRREQLVRDVQRGHDRDALAAGDFSGRLDLVHLAVQVRDRLQERLALVVLAGDAVAAPEQGHVDGLSAVRHALAHASSPGQPRQQVFQLVLGSVDFFVQALRVALRRGKLLAQLHVLGAQPLA